MKTVSVSLNCNDVYVTQTALITEEDKRQNHPLLHSFKNYVYGCLSYEGVCVCVLSLPSSTLASAQPTSPALWHLTGNFEDSGYFLCDSKPNVP